MGICPIPTSEGEQKSKKQTIIYKYDPVSRRTHDIRIDCVYPRISDIIVTPTTPTGPWKLTWTQTEATQAFVRYVSGINNLVVTDLTVDSCIIRNPNPIFIGSVTFNVQVMDPKGNTASKNVTFNVESIFTSKCFDGGNATTSYVFILDGGVYNSSYTVFIDGNYNG